MEKSKEYIDHFEDPEPENYVCLTCDSYEFQLVIVGTRMFEQKLGELDNSALQSIIEELDSIKKSKKGYKRAASKFQIIKEEIKGLTDSKIFKKYQDEKEKLLDVIEEGEAAMAFDRKMSLDSEENGKL
jgi:predicted transcriptional regulator